MIKRSVVFVLVAFASTLTAVALAQEVPPNAPKYVKSFEVPGLEVRYLDFRWDEQAFKTLQSGGPHPVGQRSWVLARFMVTTDPFKCEGKLVPVGPALLIVNPSKGGAPATLELRSVDMREVFVDMNVVAEPPPGETFYQAPAVWRTVGTRTSRLEMAATEGPGTIQVTANYGDKQTGITLTRD
jgi:hypothetical protein